MTIDEISKYLKDYIGMENPQYAVMLQGKWGCGKTYYIKEQMKLWESEDEDNGAISDDKIRLKPIYLSLSGLNYISQVSYIIKRELNPILYSKGIEVCKKVFFGAIAVASRGAVDWNRDGVKDDLSELFDAEGILKILSKSNDSIKGKCILIFDDLDRCKIPTDEVFGYINNLVEHSMCKVIIIGEEDKIKQKYDASTEVIQYKDFKEKLIGQTFGIYQEMDKIILNFISESKCEYLTENQNMIIELFNASNINNLRIVKQCFSDFNRLLNSIDISQYDKTRFNIFIQNVIAYFLITYCEYKNGNIEIKEYQDVNLLKIDDSNNDIDNKYDQILDKYQIRHSSYCLIIRKIIYFIDNGFIPGLNEIIASSEIINSKLEEDWEIIWSYRSLDDFTFSEKLKAVKEYFYRGSVDHVSAVIHITGMLLRFNRVSIGKYNEQYLLRKAKIHIDRIFSDSANKCEKQLTMGTYGTSWGKEYLELDSPEMQGFNLFPHIHTK